MECVAAWLPVETAWTVGASAGWQQPSVLPAQLGVTLRSKPAFTLEDVPPHAREAVFTLAPFVRYVHKNCTRSTTKKKSLAEVAPDAARYLAPRIAHVVALVACTRVTDTDLPIVVGDWLQGHASAEQQRTTVSFVVKLRAHVSKTPTEIVRSLVMCHDALAARRSAAFVDAVLRDGGTLLCTNKAPPFMRVACAVLASIPHIVYNAKGHKPGCLLHTCRELVPDSVCPMSADEAHWRLKRALVTVEDFCALMERLPPRLVPPTVVRTSADETLRLGSELWREPEEVGKEQEEEEQEEEEEEEASPAAGAKGGWTPEQVMSAALFHGDSCKPCARAVVIFTMRNFWTSAFKNRGWGFGVEERTALMKAEARLRPLREEHAVELIKWCEYADAVRWRANASALDPCAARMDDLRQVVDSTWDQSS